MFNKLMGKYNNGNVEVKIFTDGTKMRSYPKGENPVVYFPESIDLKITDYCDIGCLYCHEMSSQNGHHGDIMNAKFVDSLIPFTEVAIGGGDPLSHPELIPFLLKLRKNRVIANMTVNQKTMRKTGAIDMIKHLIDSKLIHGIGVSLDIVDDELNLFLDCNRNTVVHVIAGVTPIEEIRKLYNKNRKVLILGYKKYTGRGQLHYVANDKKIDYLIQEMKSNIKEIMNNISYCSFDNKAIEQLEIKKFTSEEKWNEFYQGDDGSHTMYIDMCSEVYKQSSVAERWYDLEDNIFDMFDKVKIKE